MTPSRFYHILTNHKQYQDLGRDYFECREPERLQKYMIRRLDTLGHEVILKPKHVDQII